MNNPKHDVIGYWSEVKLEIIRRYATEYSKIITAHDYIRRHIYVDAFAGSGQHISKRTGEFVPGSPLNALLVEPPFPEIHLIDLDGNRADQLRDAVGDRGDVFVHTGDSNQVLLDNVFPRCRYEEFHRALCLLDPYALSVDWKVIETAGKMKSIEIFYNFMIMDANMNVLWRNPDRVPEDQAVRMDKVWGDRTWRQAAYRTERGLFGDIEAKADNEAVAEAFRSRLREVAGFQYVPRPMPMRNTRGAVVYYLFFASPNKTGAHIVEYIFEKFRQRGML
ncbi:MAG TPA: three-Cys-motif partner protein TcmP [Pyrinomonadaceae bacterium]